MKNISHLLAAIFLTTAFHFCSNNSVGSTTAENDFISVNGPTSIQGDLGTTGTATVTIKAKDFDGDVEISLDRSELDETATDSDIEVSISTNELTLAANESQTVTISYHIRASSPAFDDGKIDIKVKIPSKDEELIVSIPVQVNPVCEIELSVDDSDVHSWKTPDGEVAIINFKAYDGDLTLRFVNLDDEAHEVHSNGKAGGAFPHQDEPGMQPSGEEGDTYEVVVNQEATVDTKYYCHSSPIDSVMNPVLTLTFNN